MPCDILGRPLKALRISVTDRCNLRCVYCMPEPDYVWLPREDLLTFEEIGALTEIFTSVGVDKVRITGGEPLLRRDLPTLVERLARNPAIADLSLTTNGILLADQIRGLVEAGLRRLNISLDTLRPDRFEALTRFDALAGVLKGIDAAMTAGVRPLKIDAVVIRGVNDDELIDLIEYGRRIDAEVRFIEYMDVAGATRWSSDLVVSRRDMLHAIEQHYGPVVPILEESSAPAARFRLPDGRTIGIISSTTEPFCRTCDRSRLTADGVWFLCLYATRGIDLRAPLRAGVPVDQIRETIIGEWTGRSDRGAEVRLQDQKRTSFLPVVALKREPHLEMHTRGG
jgi:cyclic pyranopterin phosphate synthase